VEQRRRLRSYKACWHAWQKLEEGVALNEE